MRTSTLLKAAYFACLAIDRPPSVRSICAMVKSISGKGMRSDSVRAWLSSPDTLQIRRGHEPDTPFVLRLSKRDTVGAQPGHTHTRDVIVNIKSNSSSLRSDALPGFEPTQKPSTNGHVKAPPPDKTWVQPLLDGVLALGERRISTLTPIERQDLGRAFAYHVGHCTANERNNRAKGTTVAKGLASLAFSDFGEWTVAMYLDLSIRAKKMRGDIPTLDPWIFKAALAAPERQAL